MRPARLSAELVRALRGKRSQAALGRRLGYTSNVIYTWESGRRAPTASAFFRLAAHCRVDVASGLAALFGPQMERVDPLQPAGVTALLSALTSSHRLAELASATGTDRTTIARWLRGATEPKLPQLLRLVDAMSHRLLEFVSLFADAAALPSTRTAHRDLIVQRRLAYELPWSHAVLRALELDAYRTLPAHEPGFIARRVGLSLQEEERYLAVLVDAKQIRKERGRWVVRRVLTVDTRPSEADNRRLKQHWARVGLERLSTVPHPPGALFSFNLFAIGSDEYERIRRLHIEYFERVREIVAESRTADRVALMNLQLVLLGV
jgi:transcriptional regulator with XRE-family HTH domain